MGAPNLHLVLGAVHRRSQWGTKGPCQSPKCLENIVIVCFERRFSKQNSVIWLKSNILALPKFLGWLRHWRRLTSLRPCPPYICTSLSSYRNITTTRSTSLLLSWSGWSLGYWPTEQALQLNHDKLGNQPVSSAYYLPIDQVYGAHAQSVDPVAQFASSLFGEWRSTGKYF